MAPKTNVRHPHSEGNILRHKWDVELCTVNAMKPDAHMSVRMHTLLQQSKCMRP